MHRLLFVIIVIVLLLVFYMPAREWASSAFDMAKIKCGSLFDSGASSTSADASSQQAASSTFVSDRVEKFDQPAGDVVAPGYSADTPWSDILANAELDPATKENHRAFVADVRRFSSGANFTSVADDNTSIDFTNFLGFRRPQFVPIGEDARQQPDIDSSVLARNKDLRW